MSDQPKACMFCGQDCSGRPRIKDERGRYACKTCVEARAAKPKPLQAAASSVATSPDDPVGPDLFAIAEPEVTEFRQSDRQPCAGCGRLLDAGAVICVSCGRSTTTGKAVATRTGVAEGPAALSADPRKAKRLKERAEEDAKARRNVYLVPSVVAVVGFGLSAGLTYLRLKNNSKIEAGELMAYAAMNTGITAVICTVGYLLCAVLWMGMNQSLPVVTLQMIAVVAGSKAIELAFANFIIGGIPAMIVGLLAAVWLMTTIMDLDMQDAILAAVICYVVMGMAANAIFFAIALAAG